MEMNDKGRLIYADDALRMIRNSQADNPLAGTVCAGTWKTAHESALSCVDACNTVEAVEVVHARWLDYQGKPIAEGEYHYYWTCSNCKNTLKFEDYPISLNEEDFPLNYCPNCGAKMDGGNA